MYQTARRNTSVSTSKGTVAFLEGVEPRRVADAVERLRLRELLVDERDDMAPRREHPREVLCCGRRRMKNIRG